MITCHHSPVELRRVRELEEPVPGYRSPPGFGGLLSASFVFVFGPPLLLASHAPPVIPPPRPNLGERERQSLAGTAGCPGNALCHRSGLEQELAYPCQSAGRIWAMPCVNRLSDFHSDGSGICPTPPLWKSDPGQPLSESPRALLSSPISCLNYALFCAVVVVFFIPSSSQASPSLSPHPPLPPNPPILPSVSHFAAFRRS